MPLLFDPILKDKRLDETKTLLFTQIETVTVVETGAQLSIIVPLAGGGIVGSRTIPAHYFLVGKSLIINSSGYYSCQGGANGALRMRVKLGSTTILDTGAQTNASALTNRFFNVNAIITCRTTGSSGAVFGQGRFLYSTSATDITGWDMENTGAITVDTTVAHDIDVTADWTLESASNSISGTNCIISGTSIN